MPANIETSGDQAAFVTARTPAWHRLGTVTDTALTAEQALTAAHLNDWNVQTMPLSTIGQNGETLTVPNRYATVRTNPFDRTTSDVLGVGLTEDYICFQNEEAFAWLNALTDESGAHFETAGSIDGGSKVFCTMKMPEGIQVGGVDPVDLYLTAVTSHDGSMALTTLTTPVRVVCQNTLSLALRGAQVSHKIRHNTQIEGRVAEAREVLGVTFGYADSWTSAMNDLLDREMTTREFQAMVEQEFLPTREGAAVNATNRALNQRAVLTGLFANSDTQEFGRGTRYAAFNALTEWSEWTKDTTPKSALLGTSSCLRQKAYAVLSR